MPEDYDTPLNPVELERAIRKIANEVARGVRIVTSRLDEYREAERVYDREFAREYLAHQGPAHERKYAAELATTHLRRERDLAEVAWRYSERSASSLDKQLSAFQSINRSAVQMYSAAGSMGSGG